MSKTNSSKIAAFEGNRPIVLKTTIGVDDCREGDDVEYEDSLEALGYLAQKIILHGGVMYTEGDSRVIVKMRRFGLCTYTFEGPREKMADLMRFVKFYRKMVRGHATNSMFTEEFMKKLAKKNPVAVRRTTDMDADKKPVKIAFLAACGLHQKKNLAVLSWTHITTIAEACRMVRVCECTFLEAIR